MDDRSSQSICVFTKYDGGTGWYVEHKPPLAVFLVDGVVIGEMTNGVVGKFVASVAFAVGVEHDVVAALRYDEAVVGVGTVGREVEHEQQVATREGEDLVTIVVPHFHHGGLLEVFLGLDDFEHGFIEIA